jgi:hypothetical protein
MEGTMAKTSVEDLTKNDMKLLIGALEGTVSAILKAHGIDVRDVDITGLKVKEVPPQDEEEDGAVPATPTDCIWDSISQVWRCN